MAHVRWKLDLSLLRRCSLRAGVDPLAGGSRISPVWTLLLAALALPLGVSGRVAAEVPEAADNFGLALAAGDFDGDGLDDLAISAPFEDIGNNVDAGMVQVVYGNRGRGVLSIHQNKTMGTAAEPNDQFGTALAVGDFNTDGFDDLAIGTPGEDLADLTDSGCVQVVYGTRTGLAVGTAQVLTQDLLADAPEAGDRFGAALAAGNFGLGGADDLAIGAPMETIDTVLGAGAVHVVFGRARNGLTPNRNQFLVQGKNGVEGASELGDLFGSVLLAANLGKTSHDELAIGVWAENLEGAPLIQDCGAVHVLYGTDNGLSTLDDEIWTPESPGVEGVSLPRGAFGWSLAAGRFDDDQYADLAIGVPTTSFGIFPAVGAVNVLYGGSAGVGSAHQYWHVDQPGMLGEVHQEQGFGGSLAVGNFDGDAFDDLAIGETDWNIRTGKVAVIYGTNAGLSATDNQVFFQGQGAGESGGSIEGTGEFGDAFGLSLCTGDFDNDNVSDLAVGVPYDTVGANLQAGAVNLIEGRRRSGLTPAQGARLVQP